LRSDGERIKTDGWFEEFWVWERSCEEPLVFIDVVGI